MQPDWSEEEFFKKAGSRYRCFSFAYCGYGSPLISGRHMRALDQCLDLGVHIFMDSGAHSFHNMIYRGKTLGASVSLVDRRQAIMETAKPFLANYAKYIRWCYQQKKHFDFYVTLDTDRDCQTVWDCTKQLEGMGIHPVPVYHGDQPIEWVQRYIDAGHKIIGVGISRVGKESLIGVRRYYDTVIDYCTKRSVACHGFAVTGDIMWEYPWYSADSTTWLKAAAYGKILDIRPEKQRTALIHVSNKYSSSTAYGQFQNLAPSVRKHIRDEVERRGFDLDRVQREIPYRATYNAKVLVDAVEAHTRKQHKDFTTWKPVITV